MVIPIAASIWFFHALLWPPWAWELFENNLTPYPISRKIRGITGKKYSLGRFSILLKLGWFIT
jgi:hypothetical protein